MPRATVPRCTYKEGSRRCPMDGSGSPPLCDPHRMALAEASRPRPPARVLLDSLTDWLQGNPINRDATLGAAEAFLNQWVAGIGGNYRPDIAGVSENGAHRRAQSGTDRPWNWNIPHTRQRQQPPHDPDAELRKARAAARQVLGFGPTEALNVDMIKARHRQLAKKHHPDRGGSNRKMETINLARDVLMVELG